MMKRRDLASFGVSITMHVALVAALVFMVSVAPDEVARRVTVGFKVFDKPAPHAIVNSSQSSAPSSAAGASVEADAARPAPVREVNQARRTPAASMSPLTDNPEPDRPDQQAAADGTDKAQADAGTGAAEGTATAGVGDGAGGGGGTGDPGSTVISGAGGRSTGGGSGGTSGSSPAVVGGEGSGSYALMVRRALEVRGSYPGTARRLGLEGQLKMLVSIGPDGQVSGRRIHSSSGFRELDDAALASADRLQGLPPPPGGRPVDILVPIRFSMRRM